MPISEFELQTMQRRTEKARHPAAAAAVDTAKREKWAAGEEKELQDAIEGYAQLHGCYVVRPPMHKRSQLPLGFPDLSIYFCGRCVFVEAKTQGNDLSPDQIKCHKEMRRCGCIIETVFTLQDAIAFVRRHLLP